MDKIKKALNKLNFQEKQRIKEILLKINKNNFKDLDIKKLKGKNDIFRVRKGKIRIIFYKIKDSIKVLTVERRRSKTYRKR